MDTAIIVLKLAKEIPDTEADYIGADAGALLLAKKKIRMKLAIGDFDSVNEEDLSLIRKWSDECIVLNPIKDDTDSEAALVEVLKREYQNIHMLGAFGGRLDHSYINMKLAYKYPNILSLSDERNIVTCFEKGTYVIRKRGYEYVSFFTENQVTISIEGVEYPLQERTFSAAELYTSSNRILKEEAVLTVHDGTVMMIQAKD